VKLIYPELSRGVKNGKKKYKNEKFPFVGIFLQMEISNVQGKMKKHSFLIENSPCRVVFKG